MKIKLSGHWAVHSLKQVHHMADHGTKIFPFINLMALRLYQRYIYLFDVVFSPVDL